MNTKQITLLHSNDMHGDFLADHVDDKLTGGVSMLSGYLTKCRNEDPNVIYAIAGDMFRGSVIDSEFQGLSTIQIVNLLAPDVVTLGNHETDYGVAHLLFLEKMATFPIVNANLYIKQNETRLFRPCYVMEIDGMKILFIGILTEDVISQTKGEKLIGSFIGIEEAAQEVGKICNAYNAMDIDLTVLLTHIGFEEDKKLAAALDPDWGVDVIIGGHSHTFLDEPAVVNGIPIVQAGTGTDQIGRFDMVIDTDNNCIASYKWQAVPINEENCPKDERMEELIGSIKEKTDLKYAKVVANFDYDLEHHDRWAQTELGGVFADAMKESLGVDVFLMGSGSVRKYHMGPIVTFQDFTECYPYDGKSYGLKLTGAQLKKALLHIYRDDAWLGDHTEFYQLSKGMHVIYHRPLRQMLKCELNGEPIEDDKIYTVGIQEYHYNNLPEFLNLSYEEVKANGEPRVLTTSDVQTLLEYFANNKHLGFGLDGRLEVVQ
ncbi:MAG: bifunctional metallophosphatase/5'-nucleotidase [Erysipelotrichaceae bacterium]|nr:bifunctional metallophosphatase/5'-nucleotidase [Erysipelotrichaceae bacterium]MBR5048814.1 bifunctional metallophosphatase/5'-nucleotidase [Erysipelotrichaceae bacterium]